MKFQIKGINCIYTNSLWYFELILVGFMVFNATFNNISVISWRSVLLVEETGVPGENHRPVASHWQPLSHNVLPSTHRVSIHVIELLCYNWRFANFWLEIWSHNWRFFIDVFDACFYCLLMFSFCLFQYWTNCIPFQYILFTFLSY